MPCKLVSWHEIDNMCKKLASQVEQAGFKADTMIAVARSGFVPGRVLSDLLGISDLVSLKVEHWLDKTGKHESEATIPYKVPYNIKGKRVLVVDDIVDTGKSMRIACDYLSSFGPTALKTSVMQFISSSIIVPDFFAVKVPTWTWFIYPWNLVEDLSNLIGRVLRNNGTGFRLVEIVDALSRYYSINVERTILGEIVRRLEKSGSVRRHHGLWKPALDSR